MSREYHKWFSSNLDRDMELLVFGHSGARVLVFPTRAGRFFDYENWGLVRSLQQHLDNGWLQLFCVDSMDAESFYCFWSPPQDRIKRHLQYEQYILEEVLPFTEKKNSSPFLISHGCSLGAYHAVNLAFRHPQLFSKVVAFSGRYDLTISVGSFRSLLDGHYDDAVYYNTPSHFVPNITDPDLLALLRRMEITLIIGEEDAFFENNRQFSDVLRTKDIEHQFYVWRGEAHRARYWRQMVLHYL
ncbi:esterase family protein [Leptolyngbya sp. FACHB-261]|uniref:esterase family protein n=1 Tax=Leptolyngbya sp. FACHB-261 TaxID=2692806 RepID=UPI00168683EE|nr:alpha/beta hydrolase-fold protein [Leptolyngbya sp. FACHB-261]MBD2100478.1 esterase family protein [Leptolyngbya sp. FACHB-261]